MNYWHTLVYVWCKEQTASYSFVSSSLW